MATAAVAVPSHAFSHPEPAQSVKVQSKPEQAYDDPRTAPKTKASQGYPLTEKIAPKAPGPNQLYKQKDVTYGDWRDDLVRDGYVVVKGVIPKERALQYGDAVFDFLETFPTGGFKRNDISTVLEKNLPVMNEKGMIFGYGINHEEVAWNIRQEPGLIAAYEKVHDTSDILVSFDSMNIQWPNRPDQKPNTPWPHQDQDPATASQFRCLQGLVNILPNGPNDGGLYVLKGAHARSEEFHETFKDDPEKVWSWTHEWFGFKPEHLKWLEERGHEWVKPSMEPGDLILWDSRTPHYNLVPKGDTPRLAFYTCYGPVTDASPEQLVNKKRALMETIGTTHWPNALHVGGLFPERDGKHCPHDTGKPRKEVELTQRGWKLTGIPYIN